MRKLVAFLLVLFVVGSLCACSEPTFNNAEDMLAAPRLSGDMYDVQQVLDKYVSAPHTLKYPGSGEYRAAISFADVSGNGSKEAVAFYSTTDNDVNSITLVYLTCSKKKWKVSSSVSNYSADVDQIMFKDLNGDDKKEIIVGWVLSPTDKQVSVYSLEKNILVQNLQESYSVFSCCDIDSDENKELVLCSLSTSDATAKASVYSFAGKKVSLEASCDLDGGVTGYCSPVFSALKNGKPALYVDAAKSNGTVTEVLYYEDGMLINGAYNEATLSSDLTYRPTASAIIDINGDGIPEIPLCSSFIGTAIKDGETDYLTVYCNFANKSTIKAKTVYFNTVDNYSVVFPKEWIGSVGAKYDKTEKSTTLYEIIANDDGTFLKNEFMSIKVLGKNDKHAIKKAKENGYKSFKSESGKVYYCKTTGQSNYSVSASRLNEIFEINSKVF